MKPTADLTTQLRALRNEVTLSWHDGLSLLRFDANRGIETLEPLIATDLGIRESQFRQALRLDDQGRPLADLLIGFFRGTLHVFGTGLEHAAMAEALSAQDAVQAHDDHVVISIDGPFAWELLGAWDTPSAIGLPYLGAYSPREGVLAVRAGRTGEYGYMLVVPRAQAEGIWNELLAASPMPVTVVGKETLERASLENWVFEIDREGRSGLDALELQLTWRLDLHKDAVGLDAIRAHRDAGLRRRITALRSGKPLASGARVLCEGQEIGQVLAAAETAVLSVLDTPWAEAGMTYTVDGEPVHSQSAPFVVNRSLFVNPQRHSWAGRDEVELPEGLQWQNTTSS
ncbi:MAG: aminomethyltransferase family protein [Proteobacteria bacterium]|nr:aminomethyltransferase family protein [Pseudomonadota bacterium]